MFGVFSVLKLCDLHLSASDVNFLLWTLCKYMSLHLPLILIRRLLPKLEPSSVGDWKYTKTNTVEGEENPDRANS